MDFQIGLVPVHTITWGNSGICMRRCNAVVHNGTTTCDRDECNALPEEQTLFKAVNSSLYSYLVDSCSIVSGKLSRSPCDSPKAAQACDATGFPIASAFEACSDLKKTTSASAYDSCVYDCCVTADANLCKGLAFASAAHVVDFEVELLEDGRFINAPPALPAPPFPPAPPLAPPPPPPALQHCSTHPACSHLAADCCPTIQSVYLYCCVEDPNGYFSVVQTTDGSFQLAVNFNAQPTGRVDTIDTSPAVVEAFNSQRIIVSQVDGGWRVTSVLPGENAAR